MLHTVAWLITGKRGLRYACIDQGRATSWLCRLSLEVDARLDDLVTRWEAEQEAKEAAARERAQLPYGIPDAMTDD